MNSSTTNQLSRWAPRSALCSTTLCTAILLSANLTFDLRAQTVDQEQLTATFSRAVLPGSQSGQTFTSGQAGYLAGVEISAQMSRFALPLHAAIYDDGQRVGYVRLNSEEVSAVADPDELSADEITGTYINFSPFAIPSVPGEALELRLWTSEAARLASIRMASTNVYPGGTPTVDGAVSGGDMAFKSFVMNPQIETPYDQIQPDGVDTARALLATVVTGQTMTVGKTGDLAGIELSLTAPQMPSDNLYVDVFRHGDRNPAPLGQVVLTPEQIREAEEPWFLYQGEVLGTYVDLEELDVDVQAGELLEFRLSTDNSVGIYSVRMASVTSYSRGNMTINGELSGGDLAFKLFVTPHAIFADGFESGDTTAWHDPSTPTN